MEEAKVLGARGFPGEPEPAQVRAQVLMHLQRHAGGPVRVRAVGPGGAAPPGEHECDRIGDLVLPKHAVEHVQDLCLYGRIGHAFGAVGLLIDDGDEDDGGAGEETRGVEGLPDRVVAARGRVSVEEELRALGPEGVGKLEKDFRVCAHLEGVDSFALPWWECWVKGYRVVLEYPKGERADCIGSFNAGPIVCLYVDRRRVVGDVGHGRVEQQTRVSWGEEVRGLALDEGIEAALIKDVVVCIAVLIECGVVIDDAKFLGRLFWWICIFPIFGVTKSVRWS